MKSPEDKYNDALELQQVEAELSELRILTVRDNDMYSDSYVKYKKLCGKRNKLLNTKCKVVKFRPLKVA